MLLIKIKPLRSPVASFHLQAAGVRMNADDCNGRSYMSGIKCSC